MYKNAIICYVVAKHGTRLPSHIVTASYDDVSEQVIGPKRPRPTLTLHTTTISPFSFFLPLAAAAAVDSSASQSCPLLCLDCTAQLEKLG
ncbi:hypothetical protein LWI28_012012 [Acer negundo]|uniref:Uncharacterized protein n=1 Tax=Acer negundo TaxID=4023 RepID=A0AAD5NLL6_ACENE|nr:hypothetical protein LWI28_012012 [Acer negundo]KAK4840462.1 hypothetical protein QYF36_009412 [Acer negundo]